MQKSQIRPISDLTNIAAGDSPSSDHCTPSKVHYIFNLRDLAKLAQAIMQPSLMNTTNQERLVILFVHEYLCVFADRLVTENGLAIFYKHLNATTNSCFFKSDDRLYQ